MPRQVHSSEDTSNRQGRRHRGARSVQLVAHWSYLLTYLLHNSSVERACSCERSDRFEMRWSLNCLQSRTERFGDRFKRQKQRIAAADFDQPFAFFYTIINVNCVAEMTNIIANEMPLGAFTCLADGSSCSSACVPGSASSRTEQRCKDQEGTVACNALQHK